MTDHIITGGGGVRLHVREAGNPHGRPVLFIHGYSQSFLSWIGQLGARRLGGPLRLLAMDLRGHGLSDKPPGVYTDSGLWANDVQAVISTLGLDRPVLVGWSYGGLVICDYLRFHPDTPLQGIEFVCPWTTLGTPAAQQEISSAVFALVPGLTSNTVGTAVAAVSHLIGLAFEKPPGRVGDRDRVGAGSAGVVAAPAHRAGGPGHTGLAGRRRAGLGRAAARALVRPAQAPGRGAGLA